MKVYRIATLISGSAAVALLATWGSSLEAMAQARSWNQLLDTSNGWLTLSLMFGFVIVIFGVVNALYFALSGYSDIQSCTALQITCGITAPLSIFYAGFMNAYVDAFRDRGDMGYLFSHVLEFMMVVFMALSVASVVKGCWRVQQ